MNDPIVFVKWRKPEQMKDLEGSFIMTRTDDDNPDFGISVKIKQNQVLGEDDTLERAIEYGTPVYHYDPECRFYGPIPDCQV